MKQKLKDLSERYDALEEAFRYHERDIRDDLGRICYELLGMIRLVRERTSFDENSSDDIERIVQEQVARVSAKLLELGRSEAVDKAIVQFRDILCDLESDEFEIHRKEDAAVRQRVWDLTDGKCTYCRTELVDGGVGRDSFVVEHVVPKSAGGPDRIENYVPACSACNLKKSNRHVIDAMGDQAIPALKLVQGDGA